MSVCCAVCCDAFQSDQNNPPVFLVKCRHVFHKNCIQKCFQTLEKCPLCRQDYCAEVIAFEQLHLSFLPSSNVAQNLLTEIDELQKKLDESNEKNLNLKDELAEMQINMSVLMRQGEITVKEIKLRAMEILELCKNFKS